MRESLLVHLLSTEKPFLAVAVEVTKTKFSGDLLHIVASQREPTISLGEVRRNAQALAELNGCSAAGFTLNAEAARDGGLTPEPVSYPLGSTRQDSAQLYRCLL